MLVVSKRLKYLYKAWNTYHKEKLSIFAWKKAFSFTNNL